MPVTAQFTSRAAKFFALISISFSALTCLTQINGPDWSCKKDRIGAREVKNGQYECPDDDGEMYRGPSRRDWVLIILFISLAFIFLVLTLACQYWSRRLKRKESALEQAASNCDHEEDSYQPRSMNYSIPAVHKGCKYNETMVVLDDV